MNYSDVEKYSNKWLNSITHGDMMANNFPVIIDRTEDDVKRIQELNKKRYDDLTPEEKKEWWGVVKGAYNDEDMNRVGTAVEYLAGLLNAVGYRTDLDLKTDWAVSDIPTPQQMEQYKRSVEAVRNALGGTVPIPDSLDTINYEKANALEKALLQIYQYYQLMIRNFYYSAELYTGEV